MLLCGGTKDKTYLAFINTFAKFKKMTHHEVQEGNEEFLTNELRHFLDYYLKVDNPLFLL